MVSAGRLLRISSFDQERNPLFVNEEAFPDGASLDGVLSLSLHEAPTMCQLAFCCFWVSMDAYSAPPCRPRKYSNPQATKLVSLKAGASLSFLGLKIKRSKWQNPMINGNPVFNLNKLKLITQTTQR